jgi:hypothetical protein
VTVVLKHLELDTSLERSSSAVSRWICIASLMASLLSVSVQVWSESTFAWSACCSSLHSKFSGSPLTSDSIVQMDSKMLFLKLQ